MFDRKIYPFLCGLALLILTAICYGISVNSLGPGLILASIFLCASFILRKPWSVRLIDIWLFGFIYLYFSEYFLAYDMLVNSHGRELMLETTYFVTSAFAFTLLGYSLVVKHNQNTFLTSIRTTKRSTLRLKEQLPSVLTIYWVLISLIVVFYVFVVITPQQLLFASRGTRVYGINLGYLNLVLMSFLVTFPIFTCYIIKRYRTHTIIKMFSLPMILLCISTAYLIGTRFLLGYMASGLLFVNFRGLKHLNKKQILIILLCAFVLAFGLGRVKAKRQQIGHTSRSVNTVNTNFISFESLLSLEGSLNVSALIIKVEPHKDSENPIENLFLFIYWIPRPWWPDKPTLGGYWFMRKYFGMQSGYSEEHNFSGGFYLSALMDFGVYWGAIFCIFYGILLGVFENFFDRNRNLNNSKAILAGLLVFSCFFMVRSLVTSMIVLINNIVATILPLLFLEKTGRLNTITPVVPTHLKSTRPAL